MNNLQLMGEDKKEVTFAEFKKILLTIGMCWYGVENWTGIDLSLFEESFDGFTVEPTKNDTMMIWDRNFDYSNLYK